MCIRDRHRTVQANEALGIFAFEMGQRLVEQVFAVDRARRDILEVGLEVENFSDRHEQQAAAFEARQVGAPATTHGAPDAGKQFRIGRLCGLHLLQGNKQALGADRLEQVVDGVEVKSLHRIIVVGLSLIHI